MANLRSPKRLVGGWALIALIMAVSGVLALALYYGGWR